MNTSKCSWPRKPSLSPEPKAGEAVRTEETAGSLRMSESTPFSNFAFFPRSSVLGKNDAKTEGLIVFSRLKINSSLRISSNLPYKNSLLKTLWGFYQKFNACSSLAFPAIRLTIKELLWMQWFGKIYLIQYTGTYIDIRYVYNTSYIDSFLALWKCNICYISDRSSISGRTFFEISDIFDCQTY